MLKRTIQKGLFRRLVLQLRLVNIVPSSILNFFGRALSSLKIVSEEFQGGAGALFNPLVRDAGPVFSKLFSRWILGAWEAHQQGKKVILVPFNFPVDLIHAFDNAHPLTSEVLSTLAVINLSQQGEPYWDMAMALGLPDHLCSANTIELGSLLGSDDFYPDAIVSSGPGGCDANAKIHEFVANYLNIPHFFLPKVPENSGRGRRQYSVYFNKLVSQLEEFIGEELTEEKLGRVVERANRCTQLYWELFDLQKLSPSPVPNLFSLFIYGVRFTMWGTPEGVEALEALVEITKKYLNSPEYKNKVERARCLWAYTSYYYDLAGLFNWMEEQGYSHLGDGLDLFFPQEIDTTSREAMLEGIAESAWNMPMTRQVGAESMAGSWTEDVIWAARELRADCAIYCGHHSCKQTWSVISIMRREVMKRLGIPVLVLQGDAWIKKMTPISVIQQQIDEFVQNVIASKV